MLDSFASWLVVRCARLGSSIFRVTVRSIYYQKHYWLIQRKILAEEFFLQELQRMGTAGLNGRSLNNLATFRNDFLFEEAEAEESTRFTFID